MGWTGSDLLQRALVEGTGCRERVEGTSEGYEDVATLMTS